MPDTVEAAHDGGLCCHKCVAHPDGEDCVLLPQSLSGGDFADVAGGDPSLALRMTGRALRMTRRTLRMTGRAFRMTGRQAVRAVAAPDITSKKKL